MGADPAGRLRPDRDDGVGGQHPGIGGEARLDGPAAARGAGRAGRPGHAGSTADEGEICLDLSGPPAGADDRLPGRPRAERRGDGRRLLPHRRRRERDAEGYITYVGRTDDVFKASDYKISPFELESVLIEHPAVAEAAVVPVPDPVRAAVPKAYVALAAGSEPTRGDRAVDPAHARANLAPFLRVRRIEFAELPKTVSGKIRRVELRHARGGARTRRAAPTEFSDTDFPELRG